MRQVRSRRELVARLFPGGIPDLWCPPLTHYTPEGAIDAHRMAAHVRFLARWAKGLLVPGTTGDAWELTGQEMRDVIDTVLRAVAGTDVHVLLGALHADPEASRCFVEATIADLKRRSGRDDALAALQAHRVCGFAVCPPRGAEVGQADMGRALAATLSIGVPVALYQLPQFTGNEMGPELVADLAASWPNFILFKDTSGTDRVPTAGLDYGGVFLTRGMEGEYARWLKPAGGPYDGFLLGTANSFGAHLQQVRAALEVGRRADAVELAGRLTAAVVGLFAIVRSVAVGNPFANANKLADHFAAHGPGGVDVPPPRLHAGPHLTSEMMQAAADLLRRRGLMPAHGYLEDTP